MIPSRADSGVRGMSRSSFPPQGSKEPEAEAKQNHHQNGDQHHGRPEPDPVSNRVGFGSGYPAFDDFIAFGACVGFIPDDRPAFRAMAGIVIKPIDVFLGWAFISHVPSVARAGVGVGINLPIAAILHLMAEAESSIESKDEKDRRFIMQVVQPGLAGLMDGSVSTLAPLFAAAFATRDNWNTFQIGLAAAVGAGVSMTFAEAMSDDGKLTGRGSPWLRGTVCGVMTTIGGLGHTLPYLIPNQGDHGEKAFLMATAIAILVVILELFAIAFIRKRYMDTPLLKAMFGTVIGGLIVFACGVLIGQA